MSEQLFAQIGNAILDGEKARVEVVRRKDDKVRVTVLPMRPNTEKKEGEKALTEAAEQLRAALATPLQVVASPEQIDAELARALGNYSEQRHEAAGVLADLEEAIRAGKAAGEKAGNAKSKDKGKEKTEAKASTPEAESKAAPTPEPASYGTDNPAAL